MIDFPRCQLNDEQFPTLSPPPKPGPLLVLAGADRSRTPSTMRRLPTPTPPRASSRARSCCSRLPTRPRRKCCAACGPSTSLESRASSGAGRSIPRAARAAGVRRHVQAVENFTIHDADESRDCSASGRGRRQGTKSKVNPAPGSALQRALAGAHAAADRRDGRAVFPAVRRHQGPAAGLRLHAPRKAPTRRLPVTTLLEHWLTLLIQRRRKSPEPHRFQHVLASANTRTPTLQAQITSTASAFPSPDGRRRRRPVHLLLAQRGTRTS